MTWTIFLQCMVLPCVLVAPGMLYLLAAIIFPAFREWVED